MKVLRSEYCLKTYNTGKADISQQKIVKNKDKINIKALNYIQKYNIQERKKKV